MLMIRTDDAGFVNSVTPNLGETFPNAGGVVPCFPRDLLCSSSRVWASSQGDGERVVKLRSNVQLAIAAVVLSLVVTGCLAAEDESIESPAYVEPLQGLVVDRTVTFFGRDFYGRFMDVWRDQPDTGGVDLAIIERPDPRFGSEITIEADRKVEFRAFLSPTRARTRALAESAAAMLAQRLALTAAQRRAAEGPDLAADEL